MKIVAFILLGLGVICLGYNYFVLQPILASEFGMYGNERELSDLTGLAGTVLFTFGGIFFLIVYRKTKDKLSMILMLLGFVLALVCFMVAFGRVF